MLWFFVLSQKKKPVDKKYGSRWTCSNLKQHQNIIFCNNYLWFFINNLISHQLETKYVKNSLPNPTENKIVELEAIMRFFGFDVYVEFTLNTWIHVETHVIYGIISTLVLLKILPIWTLLSWVNLTKFWIKRVCEVSNCILMTAPH